MDEPQRDERGPAPDAFAEVDDPDAVPAAGQAPGSPGPAPDAFGAGVARAECPSCGAAIVQGRTSEPWCPECGTDLRPDEE